MATMQNLAEAFAGESQANRKYLAFAKKAQDEGYAQVAKLFRVRKHRRGACSRQVPHLRRSRFEVRRNRMSAS